MNPQRARASRIMCSSHLSSSASAPSQFEIDNIRRWLEHQKTSFVGQAGGEIRITHQVKSHEFWK
jgi:hypothetical protein